MRQNKEGDVNDISRKILVICKSHVSYHLKELFNFCIISGIYPNVFKISQNTPIRNKCSLHNISVYRRVSILSNFSKVFETLIYNRLQSICQTSKLLAKNQFGFRIKRNTELAALTLMVKLLPVLEENQYAICVFFFDYSACFDALSRSILYNKLER